MLQPPKVDPKTVPLTPVGTGAPKPIPVGPLPSAPPIKGLIPLGITASIHDVNNVFQQITQAHLQAFGVKPTPGLVFDVFRGVNQGKVRDVPALFDVPKTPQEATVRTVAAATPEHTIGETPGPLALELTRAIKAGTLPEFIADNHDQVLTAFEDPGTRTALMTAIYRSGVNDPAQVVQQALFPHKESLYGRIVLSPMGPTQQIAFGIGLGIPEFAFAEGKGVAKSVKERSATPFLKTNVGLAKATVQGVKRDVTDPRHNIGNLILDLWGATSLVGGAAARGGAVAGAIREGAGAGAITRAALTKTATGTYHLGEGADVPLSSNQVAAKIQAWSLDKRIGLVEDDGQTVPMGAAAVTLSQRASQVAGLIADPFGVRGLRDRYLGVPSKIQRQLRAADRIDRDMRLALVDPVMHANQSAVGTAGVIGRIGARRWLGLDAAEQKAIQVLATDDPNPFPTWRAFHENAIRNGWGNPADHRAHLDLLGPAEKAADNPSKKLAQAITAVRDVMAEQTALRIRALGLTPEAAEGRVASVGEVVRGDLRNPARNTVIPALTGSDDVLRLAAHGRTPEQIAAELVKPHPESAGEMGKPRYTSYGDALKAVRRTLATPEAKKALTPQRVRSTVTAESAHYLPFVSPVNSRAPGVFWSARANKYGVTLPSSLPELTHEFTGDSIRAGDFRIDTTNLARESYVRTVHAVSRVNSWRRLWDHYSVELDQIPQGEQEHFKYIRDERAVNDYLKGLLTNMEQGHLSDADMKGLPEDAIENLNRFLYPSRDELRPDEHVRAVDERLLDDPRSARPGMVAKAFSALNEPLRDAMLFLRPAYLMNVINNVVMLAIHEHVLTIPNMVRAWKANDWYGPQVTRMLDALAGEGRMLSYAPTDVGRITSVSHALSSAWNVVTDRLFRRAAVIHELRRQGFRTSDEIRDAVVGSLEDDELHKKVVEASQRAKQAMVEMDNLTWAEKTYLRHLIFVYPWVSRSAVWSLRFLRDHPAQAAIFNEIGQSKEIESDPVMKHFSGWMQDAGIMPVAYGSDGNPLVVDPASVDTWSTMGEAVGLLRGDQTVSDMAGPGAEILLHLATGRDRFGRQYANRWAGPVLDTLGGLPQYSALTRGQKQEPVIPANQVTDLRGLVKREHAELKAPIYVPGSFLNTYGPLMFGGLTPRVLDREAVNARFWKAVPYPDRVKHETGLMQKEARIQADLLGRATVPAEVRAGINLVGARTLAYHDFTQKNARTPTLRERTTIDIQTLEDQHLISDTRAASLRDKLAAETDADVATFRSGLLSDAAYGKQMAQWHSDVVTVADVANRQTLDASIGKLVGSKLLDTSYTDAANADDKTLTTYGRNYLDYLRGIKKFSKRAEALRRRNMDDSEVAAELRAYVDEHAAPVTLNGKRLPPYPSLALAHLSPKEVQTLKVGLYTQPWLTMSATDKALTGYTDNPRVSEALQAFAHYNSKQFLATVYPEGERHLDQGQRTSVIKQLDKAYNLNGALIKDYRFAGLPNYARYAQLNLVKESPNKQAWTDLFERAGELYALAHPKSGTAQITVANMDDSWHEWIARVLPIIRTDQPKFYAELQPYLRADPAFLDNLISGASNG